MKLRKLYSISYSSYIANIMKLYKMAILYIYYYVYYTLQLNVSHLCAIGFQNRGGGNSRKCGSKVRPVMSKTDRVI